MQKTVGQVSPILSGLLHIASFHFQPLSGSIRLVCTTIAKANLLLLGQPLAKCSWDTQNVLQLTWSEQYNVGETHLDFYSNFGFSFRGEFIVFSSTLFWQKKALLFNICCCFSSFIHFTGKSVCNHSPMVIKDIFSFKKVDIATIQEN